MEMISIRHIRGFQKIPLYDDIVHYLLFANEMIFFTEYIEHLIKTAKELKNEEEVKSQNQL